ncbi:phosphoinositide 3-kinase regulatory subunit 4 [Anopheles aquasalis]|uniref:phosphoinositide 3-kinase regulatory subunit 4 n=1 Tax=Anopheles aquasalis TaxID=42839 RepID=UPI00215B0899|nr:phosphoinositide 3-kinase regulatory subunit 4 [Anopheles aquasalis]
MGNQLVALAPSQIFPVEHYLTGTCELELQFEKSMGSTRFMKVAKVRVDEGPAVVKVFVRHDPSLPLEQHYDRIEYIKKHLANAVNCLPFQKVLMMEKACLIVRQYVKHSLYDRVSTRPFLTLIEKKWITFQILCALHQCHKQHICHGDIKLENILITSWNWVLLSDFASFKPTHLPEDNPADYSYFFDTSRRRTCYIAPERFVRTSSGESIQPKDGPLVGDGQYCGGQLLPEMDIFSAGCALLELWTEGTAPFEFSQLLAYRRGEEDLVLRHLDGIEDGRLRELIRSMLSLDPRERLSAELYLDQERGHLFPEYFYSFLQSYLQMFSTMPVVPPDEKVVRLHADIAQIVEICRKGERAKDAELTMVHDSVGEPAEQRHEQKQKQQQQGEEERRGQDNDGLVLITSVVTSCIRGLSFCRSKLLSLEILQVLAQHTSSETILDRILPYILHQAQDAAPRVRVAALNTLTACLRLVHHLPRTDANVFPEYILPAIAPLATDSSTFVRMTYASNIAQLAETAVGFLEQSQQQCASENVQPPHYETELSALHEMLHQTVLALLTDSQSAVKQTLMESGITKLCVFFGRQKANDVILSHMITFLNDKEDRALRGAFFDCIVGVAAYVGWHCSPMLTPLLQQGLTDPEEFVIAKAIHATTLLIELGLIQKQGINEFIGECACYLAHPNLWIRHEIVELIATSVRVLSALDVQCKVRPSIAAHLQFPLIGIESPELVLDALHPPVPRPIYDAVLRSADIAALMEVLRDRRAARTKDPTVQQQQEQRSVTAPPVVGTTPESDVPVAVRNLLRRLTTEGLTELIESQLLAMSGHLLKLHRSKLAETRLTAPTGRIVLDYLPDVMDEVPLGGSGVTAGGAGTEVAAGGGASGELGTGAKGGGRMARKSESGEATGHDWQHMLGAIDSHSPSPTSPCSEVMGVVGSGGPAGSGPSAGGPAPPGTIVSVAPLSVTTPGSSLAEYSLPERSTGTQERVSDCRQELDALISKLRTRYTAYQRNRELRESSGTAAPLPAGWQLTGSPVAHLQEHKAAVSRLAALKPQMGPLFASASIDGTVRLWDCNKLDGQQSVNRSRQSYHARTPLHAVAACDAGQSLAVAGRDGTLLLLKIDTNSSKMALAQARHLEPELHQRPTPLQLGETTDEDGPVVEMHPLDQGAQSVIVYATLYGSLVGWDIRMPEPQAWRLQSDLRSGVITTFCIDPTSSWLTVGTSSGRHICWDLRFRLPIAEIKHPNDARVRRVSHHPTESSWLVSALQGNNEVSVWNIETGHRQQTFWASPNPPLSNSSASTQCVSAMVQGVVDGRPFLLTGGADQRIRYWDPANVENCAMIVPSARDHTPLFLRYESRLIDGTKVIIEDNNGGSSGGGGGAAAAAVAGVMSPNSNTTSISSSSLNNTGHPATIGSSITGAVRTGAGGAGSGPGTGPATTVDGSSGADLRRTEFDDLRLGTDMPNQGHNDVISDMLMCRTAKQTFIASASRDGVIKLWK